MEKRVRVIVSRRVQGVFFRANTVDMARTLALRGWVRNKSDGTVEAVFQGSEEAVDEAVNWCRRGPPYAKVTDIGIFPETTGDELKTFTVRY